MYGQISELLIFYILSSQYLLCYCCFGTYTLQPSFCPDLQDIVLLLSYINSFQPSRLLNSLCFSCLIFRDEVMSLLYIIHLSQLPRFCWFYHNILTAISKKEHRVWLYVFTNSLTQAGSDKSILSVYQIRIQFSFS